MKRKLLLGILLVSLLVLASCTIGQRAYRGPQTTNFYDGTDGLVVDFLDQAPPSEVFETSEFDVQLYVKNKGAFSVMPPYGVLVDLTFDSSKVTALTGYTGDGEKGISNDILKAIAGEGNSASASVNTASGGFLIEGKNPNWINGEEKYLSLARFKASEIAGNFQKNTVTFITQMCYPYETSFASEVCIDTDTQGTSQREEVCEKQDYSYSGGQGAPVAITAVESQMIPRGVYVQPQFTIHIAHNGKGVVSYRDINDEGYSLDQCRDILSENINKISVKAMLGGDVLTCLPNEIYLKGGKTKIQCQLAQNSILGVSTNYETSLIIGIGYQYSESFRKDIIVHKSEGTGFENQQTTNPLNCFDWQVLDSTTQKCISKCDFQAKYQRDAFANTDIPELMKTRLAESVSEDYLWSQVSCNYRGSAYCKDNPRLCILQNDLCPPGDFCGMPECLIRNIPPTITNHALIGDKITFSCTDGDDALNIKQTCGCIDNAFYAFTNKSEACEWSGADLKEVQGQRKNLFGIQYDVNWKDEPDIENKRLCVMVKDKLNANSTLSLPYPFR